MPVRVYLFKHTTNEMLERTTGEQYSGLEPEDPNKQLLKEPSLLPKAMINKMFQYVSSYSLKVFSSIYDPYKALLLPLKAIVSCISHTRDFWPQT